jgi:hypothetical protein
MVATSAVHEAPRQTTVAAGKLQPAWTPSQVALQAEPSPGQAFSGPIGLPVTSVQVPSWPARPHAWHLPAQSVSQQWPLAQWPVAHSVPCAHCAPPDFLDTHNPAEQ